MTELSRRDLMKAGGVLAVGLATPNLLASLARADVLRRAKGLGPASDRILVVCQLSGGNDGLNTVVPYADPLYRAARPSLALKESEVLPIGDGMGLHPALAGLHELFGRGQVAIVQGVGYPQPNRSHFKSMEIWQSASPEGTYATGWLGRYFDQRLQSSALNPVVALGLSTEKPLALSAKKASIPCFASLADIEAMVGDPDSERHLRAIQGADAAPGTGIRAAQEASRTALDAMSELNKRLDTFTPAGSYANDAFGQGFRQIAHLIGASPATRLVYFSAGGFDTHARQADQHQKLLKGFGDALLAFQNDLEAMGKAERVVVVAFSEFGRRVAENSSAGTDHGAAAPLFVVGKSVKGGLHGRKPDLANLNRGDLRHEIDFRQVYATTLDRWLGADSGVILGGKFESLDVL